MGSWGVGDGEGIVGWGTRSQCSARQVDSEVQIARKQHTNLSTGTQFEASFCPGLLFVEQHPSVRNTNFIKGDFNPVH